jgi:type IV pilus assembly protein PilZ
MRPLMSTSENRQYGRAPIELKVDYRKLNSFFADYTKNISKGGTYIKTRKSLPIGTRFVFRLSVPAREVPFELNGEVVRFAAGDEEPGMGIRFVWGDELERMEFERTVEQLMELSLGPELAANLLRHAHDRHEKQ